MADEKPSGEKTIYRSTIPMHVRQLATAERRKLTDIATTRANDPSIFEDVEPFFFTTRASNNQVDSYFTYMAESSLTNFAADATDPGVQFQVSHNGGGSIFGGGGEVGFGRSLEGRVQGPKNDKSCLIDFYTVPGLQCGNMTSDQFILGARSGIYADVSVGFSPGQMICNICDNDFLKRWDGEGEGCTHWPGATYKVPKGRSTVEETCVLRVENGHLNEVSTVYDGATPGAGIVAVDMARMAAAAGQLGPTDAQLLENIYRVRIAPERTWALGEVRTVTTTGNAIGSTAIQPARTVSPSEAAPAVAAEPDVQNPSVTGQEEETVVTLRKKDVAPVAPPEDPLDRLKAKFADTVVELKGNDPYRMIDGLAELVVSQQAQMAELERDASYGKQAHDALLADLDVVVVRAFGGEGAEERKKRYRRQASSLDLAEIKELITDLEHRAGDRFKGGRVTRDATDVEGEEPETIADRRGERRGPTRADLAGV